CRCTSRWRARRPPVRKPCRSEARPLLRPAKAGSLSRIHARKRFPSSLRQFRGQHRFSLLFAKRLKILANLLIGKSENSCSQERRILRARGANGECANGNASRHLRNRKERVQTVQGRRLNRNPEHR